MTAAIEQASHPVRDERRAAWVAERAWIARAKAGDRDAFAAIFRQYRPRIRAYCGGILGNASDAEDVTQETFLRAYHALRKTTDDLALNAWLHRIAANACTDLLRRRRTVAVSPDDAPQYEQPSHHWEDDPVATLLDAEGCGAIGVALRALSPRYRQALVLRAYASRSPAEIGELLDLSAPAVKSLLFRARREFGKHYRP